MNRVVAVAAASIDAVKAAHANVIHEIKERRGIICFAAGLGGLGLGVTGAAGITSRDSSLLIGISSSLYGRSAAHHEFNY
jgi:hypothetical protein